MSALSSVYMPIRAGLSIGGSGPESAHIDKLTRYALIPLQQQNHFDSAINDLYELRSEAGIYADNLDSETFQIGKRFLLAFPKSLPVPELSLDNDGEISFAWLGSSGRMFSLSLRTDGRVSYAGRLGFGRTVYGSEVFDDAVPARVVESIKTIFGG